MGKMRDILTPDEAQRVTEVISSHSQFIERVATQYAPNMADVPDIVQEVHLRVCRGLNGFRDESHIQTWLYRLTMNEARRYYDQQRRHGQVTEAVPAEIPEQIADVDIEEGVFQNRRAEALHAAIGQLRPQHQVAIRNDLQPAAVKCSSRWTRHRARQRLYQLLKDDPRLES